jgi:hypothetical protein
MGLIDLEKQKEPSDSKKAIEKILTILVPRH